MYNSAKLPLLYYFKANRTDYAIHIHHHHLSLSQPMSDTMTATTDQWLEFFDQPLMDAVPTQEGFSGDATMVTTTSPTMSLSPSNSSYTTSGSHLSTPKAGNVSKPIRRRSRASKRTPTTLLNANTTNFRALVQQFTGCPSTAMSLGVHKGPITLNFQQGAHSIQHDKSKIMSPFSNKPASYNQVFPVGGSLPRQNQPEQLPQHQHQHQQQQQQQQSGYNSSFDYLKSSSFVSSARNSRPSMEISDGLIIDNDFSLHELTMNNNSFSADIKNDGYFM